MQKQYQHLRELIEAEKDDIIAEGRRHKAVHDDAVKCLRETMAILKQERITQELDLNDDCERSGLDIETLAQLECKPQQNTPISTLIRYAQKIGKKLKITLEDTEKSLH